jgi:hypothetical protein
VFWGPLKQKSKQTKKGKQTKKANKSKRPKTKKWRKPFFYLFRRFI